MACTCCSAPIVRSTPLASGRSASGVGSWCLRHTHTQPPCEPRAQHPFPLPVLDTHPSSATGGIWMDSRYSAASWSTGMRRPVSRHSSLRSMDRLLSSCATANRGGVVRPQVAPLSAPTGWSAEGVGWVRCAYLGVVRGELPPRLLGLPRLHVPVAAHARRRRLAGLALLEHHLRRVPYARVSPVTAHTHVAQGKGRTPTRCGPSGSAFLPMACSSCSFRFLSASSASAPNSSARQK